MTLDELRTQFPAAPEYLTQIFLIQRDHGTVTNSHLAQRLDISRPSVSQTVGRLKKLNLVQQDRYGAINLSAEGFYQAEKVVRSHFLIEHLLVNILKYPWDKADNEAQTLQSVLSDELIHHLQVYLKHPQTCPHGNPMPGSPLEKKYLKAPLLSEAPEGKNLNIIRITEEGEMVEGMLSFCQINKLSPGKTWTLIAQEKEQSLCSNAEGKSLQVPKKFARHLCWDPA